MSTDHKSLGSVIDEIIAALTAIEPSARVTAIKAVCEHLNISLPTDPRALASAIEEITAAVVAPTPSAPESPSNIRSFKEQKQPSTAIEMASVMAYYLQNYAAGEDHKTEIIAADITKYFVQANYPLPNRPSQLLIDAKAAGYFDSSGRGSYKLNAVGHNLVAHSLPRGATGTAAIVRSRGKTKTGIKNKRNRRTRS